MTKQHTPGPWRIGSRQTSTPSYIDAGKGFNYRLITRVRDVDMDEGKANARLIAAAPDLLAACVEMVAGNMGQPRGVGVPALDAMRAAIDKATGGEA